MRLGQPWPLSAADPGIKATIGSTEVFRLSADEIKSYNSWMEVKPLLRAKATAPLHFSGKVHKSKF